MAAKESSERTLLLLILRGKISENSVRSKYYFVADSQ
jgi:hypothetical protein